VFWVGADESIQSAMGGYGWWQRAQVSPPGTASLRSAIAVNADFFGKADVYWIGPAGSVENAYGGGLSWALTSIAGAGGASASGAITVATVASPTRYATEAFWVAPDGALRRSSRTGGMPPSAIADCRSASIATGLAVASNGTAAPELWWIDVDETPMRNSALRRAVWDD